MGYVNFLFKGLQGRQKEFRRDQYPDEGTYFVYYENAKKIAKLTGNITDTRTEANYKYISVDEAFQFNILNDEIRKTCSDTWGRLKGNSERTYIITAVVGLAGLGLAAALATSMISIALVVGAISLGILGFSALVLYRQRQAKSQQRLWDDPTERFIQECQIKHQQLLLESQKQTPKEVKANPHQNDHIKHLKLKVNEYIQKIKKHTEQLEVLKKQSLEPSESNWNEFDRLSIQKFNETLLRLEQETKDIEKQLENEEGEAVEKLKKELSNKAETAKRVTEFHQNRRRMAIENAKQNILKKIESEERSRSVWLKQIAQLLEFYSVTLAVVSKMQIDDMLKEYLDDYPELKNWQDLQCLN